MWILFVLLPACTLIYFLCAWRFLKADSSTKLSQMTPAEMIREKRVKKHMLITHHDENNAIFPTHKISPDLTRKILDMQESNTRYIDTRYL